MRMDDDWGTEPAHGGGQGAPARRAHIYDFGDGWEHWLTITNRRPGEPDLFYPRFIDGDRNAPSEDCGGIPGFCELLEAGPAYPSDAHLKE